MHPRQERRAKNESLFRDVNERIEQIATKLEVTDSTEFVCECDDLACVDRLEMGLSDYEHVRGDPTTFLVVPGHEDPAVEDVVEEHERYNLVRKHPGEPARVAAENSPRQ